MLTAGIFAGFYFLVKIHDEVKTKTVQLIYKKGFFENELYIIQGQPSDYYNGGEFIENVHPYSEDLDVFGSFSLFSLLNRAATSFGINRLRDSFLLKTNEPINRIQEATQEIVAKKKWHEAFLSVLFPLIESDKSKTQAVYDFTFEDEIKNEKLISLYSKILPFLWIGIIAAGFLVSWTITSVIGFIIYLVNLSIVGRYRKLSEAYFVRVEGVYRTLQPIERAVEIILSEDWKAAKNSKLKSQIPQSAEVQNPIKAFSYLVKKLEIRRNQMAALFYYIYSPFDVIQLVKLKRWNEQNPGFFKEILTVIGEFEILASFATCAVNHPDWTFPILSEEQPFELRGKQIGHPLLSSSSNVRNDFDIQNQNRISLITGSNMSGKSTFLRSAGTNILLAYMGAPVCAESLRLSKNIEMITYMRIKDDLNLNVSTFKAEINRVKMIVNGIDANKNHLFLIDEMLRGTNSEDKLKGAIALLRKIAKSDTYSLVATHDLRATEVASEYPEIIQNFFFEFKNVNNDLEFDYKIKAGVCTSFNASQLLKQVGLPID
jgi:DNA mismatch repair ATPase MutS